MAGIYIHIPFCRKACHYCNFHFSTQTQHIQPFTEALLKEIELQKEYVNEPIETIYLGGGTPSLLPAESISKIIEQIHLHFKLADAIECTLEANPDDIHLEQVKAWEKLGINRLSIGIQSFQKKALAWMNRAHTIEQSHRSIEHAHTAGIKNISVDLIYGTPNLTDQALEADLKTIQSYQIPHVSCYALTVEEHTALHKMIEQKKIADVNAEHQLRHFEMVTASLEQNGLEHYEISNFAKVGHRSKHNSNYWKGAPYLGLGPSAHSFNVESRQWNVSNNQLYIQSIQNNIVPFELEHLNLTTRYNEYMMISLRCMEGFSLSSIKEKFGIDFYQHTLDVATEFIDKKQLIPTSQGYTLHSSAKFLADGIASSFFWID